MPHPEPSSEPLTYADLTDQERAALIKPGELAIAAIDDSAERFVVIPTRFDRPWLDSLVKVCQSVATVVVVHTEPGHDPIPGTVSVRSDVRNIQAWWNAGIDQCSGPTLVLNDDLVVTAESLSALFDALEDADLVYVTGRQGTTPLSGWCFGLHPDGIRPDEAFRWWFGDDDLYNRAVRDNLRIVALDLPDVIHVRTGPTFPDPDLAVLAASDRLLYLERWG